MATAAPAAGGKTTSRKSPSAPQPDGGGLGAWFKVKTNRYLAAGIAVLAIGLVAWFVVMSGKRKEEFAARALDQARGAAEAGNLPLAASELQKVISTFSGTKAAQEAVITLNQVRLVNGQGELAAVGLQDFLKSNPDREFLSPTYGLLGRAYENANRPADAAAAYENASKSADLDYLKADFLLDAGRAYVSAGQKDKAIAAYQAILKDYPKTSSFVEAQVRLAELTEGKM
ncbi:MAG TPA: tetratricopeptide repeat protein [Gemmatimonadales bacterium]|nr:tetratricopeptide repeat protein [Gemmatimonadales bacterium]